MFKPSQAKPDKQKEFIKDAHAELKRAREQLWAAHFTTNLTAAAAAFQQLETKIAKQLGKIDPSDEMGKLLGAARLGVWAGNYLSNPQLASAYKVHLRLFGDSKDWVQFVVHVFWHGKDTSLTGCEVYCFYLETLAKSTVSEEFLKFLGSLTTLKSTVDIITKERLLRRLAVLDVKVNWLSEQLGDVYLKKQDWQAAHNYYELVPKHNVSAELWRKLGYTAERQNDYQAARTSYEKAGAWLRAGIVCCQLQSYDDALGFLSQVPDTARRSAPWLYHTGLANFKTRNYASAYVLWRDLYQQFPNDVTVTTNLATVANWKLYTELKNGDSTYTLLTDTSSDALHQEATFRDAIRALTVERRAEAAKVQLQELSKTYPYPKLLRTYLALRFAEIDGPEADRKLYDNLTETAGTGAMFLLLRGLMLAPTQPEISASYIMRAFREHSTRRGWRRASATALALLNAHKKISLPADISLTPEWQSTSEQISTGKFTAVSDYVRRGNKLPNALPSELAYEHGLLPIIELAQSAQFEGAYKALQNNSFTGWSAAHVETVTDQLLASLRRQTSSTQQWLEALKWATEEVKRHLHDVSYIQRADLLAPFVSQSLWDAGRYDELIRKSLAELSEQPNNVSIHHCLAIYYTAQAVHEDESGAVADASNALYNPKTWNKALGHWAVTLANDAYWKTWAQTRETIYDAQLETVTISDLRETFLPSQLTDYHLDQAQKFDGSERSRVHQSLSSSLPVEVLAARNFAKCVQSKQRTANSIVLKVQMFPSPMLLQMYGHTDIGRKFLDELPKTTATTNNVASLRELLSPLAEVYRLIQAEKLAAALTLLRTFVVRKLELVEAKALFAKLATRYATELINARQFSDARTLAQEGLTLTNSNSEMLTTLANATVGWATIQLANEDKLESVIAELRNIMGRVPNHKEIKLTLADALLKWANKAIMDEQDRQALDRVQQALQVDRTETAICRGAAYIYHDLAVTILNQSVDNLQSANLPLALQYVQSMLELHTDDKINEFGAKVYKRAAMQIADRDNYKQAFEYAAVALKIFPNRQNAEFAVYIEHDWANSCARKEDYRQALWHMKSAYDQATRIEEIDEETEVFDEIDFESRLASLHNSYGVQLGQSGQTRLAKGS